MQYFPLIPSLSEIFLKFIVVLFQNIQPSCQPDEEPKTPGMFPVYVYPSPTTPARCHPPPPPALVDAKLDQHNTNQVRTCITYLLLSILSIGHIYNPVFSIFPAYSCKRFSLLILAVSLFLPLSFSLYLSFSLSLYLSISPPPFSINLSIPFSFYFLAILFLNQTIMKANLTKLSPTKGPIANSPLTFVDWCVYTSTSMGLFLSMGASGFLPNWLEVSRNSSLGAAPISTRT